MKGSVSGYTSNLQTVIDGTTKLYAMPDGALYWYGNECTWNTGGWGSELSGYSEYYNYKQNGTKYGTYMVFSAKAPYMLPYMATNGAVNLYAYSVCKIHLKKYTATVGTNDDKTAPYPCVGTNGGHAFTSQVGSTSAISLTDFTTSCNVSHLGNGQFFVGTRYGWAGGAPTIYGEVDMICLV